MIFQLDDIINNSKVISIDNTSFDLSNADASENLKNFIEKLGSHVSLISDRQFTYASTDYGVHWTLIRFPEAVASMC